MKDNVLIKYTNSEEYKTSFDGSISSVELNGQKLTEIHDLAKKCDFLTKIFILLSKLVRIRSKTIIHAIKQNFAECNFLLKIFDLLC